jgi:hypothetical protein
VLGFAQLIHYDDKVIHTEYSALMSKVMTNGNGRIKFPINEPRTARRRARSRSSSTYYRAGTQHIALRTEDIVGDGPPLRDNGIEFLGMPHAYYEHAADRVGDVGVPIETLEELGIEADRDEEGYLLQIFTRPDPGSPDVLLRDHRAPRLARLRRRQLQGAVRGDRARAGRTREPVTSPRGVVSVAFSAPRRTAGTRRLVATAAMLESKELLATGPTSSTMIVLARDIDTIQRTRLVRVVSRSPRPGGLPVFGEQIMTTGFEQHRCRGTSRPSWTRTVKSID